MYCNTVEMHLLHDAIHQMTTSVKIFSCTEMEGGFFLLLFIILFYFCMCVRVRMKR